MCSLRTKVIMILMSGSCHKYFLFLCIELANKSKWPKVGAGSNNEECDYHIGVEATLPAAITLKKCL